MDLSRLSALPDSARVWIHGFRDALDSESKRIISDSMDSFVSTWVSHRRPVQAAYSIVHHRFLVTAAHCHGGISGCSADGFVRVLQGLREVGIDGLETGLVFFRGTDGQIHSVEHLDFYETVESGEVMETTPVFDTLIRDLGSLRSGGFEIRFGDSWHAKTYSGGGLLSG